MYSKRVFQMTGPNKVAPLYAEQNKTTIRMSIVNEVVLPWFIIWGLLMLGSLGFSFWLVTEVKDPTHNDMLAMVGIALCIGSLSSLFSLGFLIDRYHLRTSETYVEQYEQPEDEYDGPTEKIMRTVKKGTRGRTVYEFAEWELPALAVQCFNPDGDWRESPNFAYRQLKSAGFRNSDRTGPTITKDFVRLGWIDKDLPHNWTAKGKSELWEYYPHPQRPEGL